MELRSIYFPYCLEPLEDGSWIILNRDYKPVGTNNSFFVRYEDHPGKVRIKNINKSIRQKLDHNGEHEGRLYLYNDGCVPTDGKKEMESYLRKLEILMKLQIEEYNN